MCTAVGDDPSLICSLSHDTILFHDSWYPECHLITGMEPPSRRGLSIGVFPNPARGTVTVQLPASHSQGTLIIQDVYGRNSLDLPVGCENSQVTLDLTEMPAGLYFLRFNSGSDHLKPVKILLK